MKTNDTYIDDAGLGFGPSVDEETGIIRWSDCGGSEIFARGGQDEADAVDTLLRDDERELPGDPEDESDDSGLIAFWGRVERAVRKVCGHACDSEEEVPPAAGPNKDDVRNWDTVTTYGSTFPVGDGYEEGACDVEVQIGDDEGIWFVRTCDDAGGSDEADDTQYATEAEARAAAEQFAADHDECLGKSASQYLADELEERASEGEDPEGEFALYWETSLEDAGVRARYSTHAAACAAAALAQAKFNAANPAGGGVTYLCGFSVRRLVDGEWMPAGG